MYVLITYNSTWKWAQSVKYAKNKRILSWLYHLFVSILPCSWHNLSQFCHVVDIRSWNDSKILLTIFLQRPLLICVTGSLYARHNMLLMFDKIFTLWMAGSEAEPRPHSSLTLVGRSFDVRAKIIQWVDFLLNWIRLRDFPANEMKYFCIMFMK